MTRPGTDFPRVGRARWALRDWKVARVDPNALWPGRTQTSALGSMRSTFNSMDTEGDRAPVSPIP